VVCASQPSYDGFSHFVAAIAAPKHSLMAMFTLYCDDSGTHAQSDVAVAACYIAPVEQWAEFKRNWDEANSREQFGTFHMADFVARKEQFRSPDWNDSVKRDRTIKALINIIRTRIQVGFAAVVVKSAYDEIIRNGEFADKFEKNHYAFAVRLCTVMVDRWRAQHRYTAPIQYVFDRMSKGRAHIDAIFDTLLLGGDLAFNRYGVFRDCWSFQDKSQLVQLQAADIWAWENYRYMTDCFMPSQGGQNPKNPRASYLELRRSPVHTRYHIRHSLEELVRQLRQGTRDLKV
jgi:hypothetical protein